MQEKYSGSIEYSLENQQVLSINVNIQAPLIIIPENCFDKETAMIVADFGKLSVLKTLDSTEQNNVENFVYSTFRVEMSSLKLFTTNSRYWSSHFGRVEEQYCKFVIDNFDVKFSIELCTVTDSDLPKIRIFASMPALHLSASAVVIKDIQRIANTIVGNPSTESKSTAPKLEETSAAIGIYGADAPLTNVTNAEIALSINELSVSLKRDNGQTIVMAVFENMSAHCIQRSFDLKVDVVLQSFYIRDLLQTNGTEFEYLVRSPKDLNTPLIKLCYSMIQKESPHYNAIDSLIFANFDTLHIMFNRPTIVELIQVANSITSNEKAPPTQSGPSANFPANQDKKLDKNYSTILMK